ncbi:MAG: tRNA pseudouridine(55) synthase TruB [Usitatibacter sp.]
MRLAADGVLLLDKPEGYSSTQALARSKRALAAPKAGHTGTLDPFATGLLPLAFGEATKFSRFLIESTKSYRATLKLGVESSTGDTEGELSAPVHVNVDLATIDEVLARFRGVQQQVPPMHSALHVGGKRLYQLAREGIEVHREPRQVEVIALARDQLEGDCLFVSVTCSKGTYIRTLAADIGRALGCGAYLTALRRTAVGPFCVSAAVPLEHLQQEGPELARARLLPVDVLVGSLRRCDVPPELALRFRQGQVIDWTEAAGGSEWGVWDAGGVFLGVGKAELPGRLAPLRLMAANALQAP